MSTPPAGPDAEHRSARVLAALLAGAGVLHVVVPGPFDAIVPRALPGAARGWTYASGAVELICAALLVGRRTRPAGATLAAATFVAVFPANVQAALDHRSWSPAAVVLWARLPLQVPLVVWAVRIARRHRVHAPRADAPRVIVGP